MSGLSHVNERGEARMVDVAQREVSVRTAVATGRVTTTAAPAIADGSVPKGMCWPPPGSPGSWPPNAPPT